VRTLRSSVFRFALLCAAMGIAYAAVSTVDIVWMARRHHHHHMFVPMPARAAATVNSVSIVDIAANVTDVLPLITLAQGEHVLAVDDQPVENDLVAGQLIDRYRRGQFSYVDVTTNVRRILVLQH
jgi:hypothetical protein